MTLTTDWDSFLEELPDWPDRPVYLSRQGVLTVATVSDSTGKRLMVTSTSKPLSEAEANLLDKGRAVRKGRWTPATDAIGDGGDFYIAGVSYLSGEDKPGLWLDVFPYRPTPSDVLAHLLNEFHAEGLIQETDRDLFSRLSRPNVVILSPEEVQGFIDRHRQSSPPPIEELEPTEAMQKADEILEQPVTERRRFRFFRRR